MAAEVDRTEYGGFKYQWARYVARQSLQKEIDLLKQNITSARENIDPQLASDTLPGLLQDPLLPGTKLRDIARNADKLTFGKSPETPGKFHMGIVGSGCAGLFTAMIIDELNKRFDKLNITYDILEANGPKRLGGRLYTHRFTPDPKEHQYYDIGAMRFPKNDVMDRTFRLFDLLGMKAEGDNPALVPYYFKDYDNVCPSYYNDVRVWGKPAFKDLKDPLSEESKKEVDPFNVNSWLPPNDPNRISKDVIEYDPGEIVDRAIKKLVDKIQEDLNKEKAKKPSPIKTGVPDEGWKTLMAADYLSVRQFLRSGKLPNLDIEGCNYNFNTLEWLETYALATGWYDQSLSELVIDALDFGTPQVPEDGQDPNTPPDQIKYKNMWYCIEGGSQLLAERMATKVKKQPEFNKQVTAIETDLSSGNITLKLKTTKPDEWVKTETFEPQTESRSYFTVFNSTTLGALQRMDLSKANLLYGTKQAIRSLRYGASCKVGIRFKTMWWKKAPFNIKKAGLAHTDLPLRTCVYPSYNVGDDADRPAVILCSYTWAQDAQRIGTLIDPNSPANEQELRDLMLSNLAQLHANPSPDAGPEYNYENLLKKLQDEYIEHHAYDWYHDPNMSGAFAYFGPGQFSQMWPEIIKPNGWLFLIGEASAAHHAWVVGGLESAVRAVYQLLQLLHEQAHKEGINFDGYAQAMKFLEGDMENKKDPDWNLPFVGLPREIPVHQLGTKKDEPVQILPEDDVDLTFVAAQCISSFLELAVQVAKEEDQAKKQAEVQV